MFNRVSNCLSLWQDKGKSLENLLRIEIVLFLVKFKCYWDDQMYLPVIHPFPPLNSFPPSFLSSLYCLLNSFPTNRHFSLLTG